MNFWIWWTSQADCERIGADGAGLPAHLPQWLKDEYSSRCGRHGRGRLWVTRALGEIPNQVEYELFELRPSFESYAGIVIPDGLLADITLLPGFVTDFELRGLWETGG